MPKRGRQAKEDDEKWRNAVAKSASLVGREGSIQLSELCGAAIEFGNKKGEWEPGVVTSVNSSSTWAWAQRKARNDGQRRVQVDLNASLRRKSWRLVTPEWRSDEEFPVTAIYCFSGKSCFE